MIGGIAGKLSIINISITDVHGIPHSAILNLDGKNPSQLDASAHIIPKALELLREIEKASSGGK
ncbi:MAG: hypothetical protein WC823_05940 [Parcubacteria group bacterium]|jgi:hypothetical protein